MPKRDLLLRRLDEIARSLERSGRARALLALGSCGVATERLDEHSDLDFFVIARQGEKQGFIGDLGWLAEVGPIAFSYRNTIDGHKALFADGVFCEFAVFEAHELAGIPFTPGRVVWHEAGFDAAACAPALPPPEPPERSLDWLLGEILTGLFAGLCRLARGETEAAFRLIEVEALDRLLELEALAEPGHGAAADPYNPVRRLEQRFPLVARELPAFQQGYARCRESARAILEFVTARWPVEPTIADRIRELCDAAETR